MESQLRQSLLPASRAKPGEKAAQPGRAQICADPRKASDDAAQAVNLEGEDRPILTMPHYRNAPGDTHEPRTGETR